MEVVLVHWRIKPDHLEAFKASRYWPTLDPKPGFLGETMFRSVETDAGYIRFVRVGRWRRREDFYAALDLMPGQVPPKEDFEAEPRVREWLTLTLDDTADEMALPL